jgi:hypothetical protein
MEQFYKPYLSDDSDTETDSDGYISEESLLNIPGKEEPKSIKDSEPIKVATKFEQQEYKNTTLITINSRDRDTNVYPQPTFFTLRLPRVFKNVKTINLSQINLLNSFFNFSFSAGNTYLYIKEQDRPVVKITIRDGTYNANDLVTELNGALNATPLFADITFSNFLFLFQTTGDFSPLFNTPGDIVYDTLTQTYLQNQTMTDVINRYFVTSQNIGTVVYTQNQCLVAYYYPVIKEMTIAGEYFDISTTFSSKDEAYTYIIFYFQGLNDEAIINLINTSDNIRLFENYRSENTYNNFLVNKYNCTYNTKQGRLVINAPSLSSSISNDITSKYNFFLDQAILSNADFTDTNDFLNQYSNITNLNNAVFNFYNFIHTRFTINFGINFGQYTSDFFANGQNQIVLYNTSNKYGWSLNLSPETNLTAISSNSPPIQQQILWNNIRFPSTLYPGGNFISTIFSTSALSFSNSGENTLGYFDVEFPIHPTSYQRLVFSSPFRRNINIMTIPRYSTTKTSTNDMIFNLSPSYTPKLFDLSRPSTIFIRTDISGNTLLNIYNIQQIMFDDPNFMRFENIWINYVTPQILSGLRIQPTNENYNKNPPINDINLASYRPFIFFEVTADAYIVDPDAHFNITLYVETQDETPFSVPIIITAYKDRAVWMADIAYDIAGNIYENNPNHFFQRVEYEPGTNSLQLTIDVNNYQHVYFKIVSVDVPGEIPIRVFSLLTDTYGTNIRSTIRTDYFDLPFTQSTLFEQTTPLSPKYASPLSSIYNNNVIQLGYDLSGVSNNLLDYTINAGLDNFYDPISIKDFTTTTTSTLNGLQYYFSLKTSGSNNPPPNLTSWSLFFGSNSCNIIYDYSEKYLVGGQPFNCFTVDFKLMNWWDSLITTNREYYYTPRSTIGGLVNFTQYIGDYSVFLPASNNPPLITDSLTPNYEDIRGFSGIGFFLPPNQIVNLTDLTLKFSYTQPSFDENDILFTRVYSPLVYSGQINTNLYYRNQTTYTSTNTDGDLYQDWDDWYLLNRQNIKLGIFNTNDVSLRNLSSIHLSNAIVTMTLNQITQVNNFRDNLGTIRSREPEWGTYYRYTFESQATPRWDTDVSVWSTGVTSTFYNRVVEADSGPIFSIGPTSYSNYFKTNPNLFNYTYLPQAYGLAPSIANAIQNPTTISTFQSDSSNSYIAIPFSFNRITSTYQMGCYHGLTFTYLPSMPSTSLTGTSPYFGPMGVQGWTILSSIFTQISSPMVANTQDYYYWNAKLSWRVLETDYDPAGDIEVFGGFEGISGEYQNTVLFVYKNNTPNADFKDILSTNNWLWGQEKATNYIAYDSNSGYNNLSYLHNILIERNKEYAIHVRGYDPIPSFTSGLRIIGKDYMDFGIIKLSEIAEEVSSLKGFIPITDADASYYNSLLVYSTNSILYNQVVSTNTYIRLSNSSSRFSLQYANSLVKFDKTFSTTITFGKTQTYSGLTFTFNNYEQAISTYISLFNNTRSILSTFNDTLSTANGNLNQYIIDRYENILPISTLFRSRKTDPLPFQILFSTYLSTPYTYQYDQWGLGYNLGFNKADTSLSVTAVSDTFIRILQNYIYLRISPEYNTNTMATSGKEMLAECRDSAGEEAKYFSKILLNDFGSYCQTAIQRPKDFNPIQGKYEVMTCQLTDKYGTQLSNIDCEYDFVLQIDEITNGPKDNSSLVSPDGALNIYK